MTFADEAETIAQKSDESLDADAIEAEIKHARDKYNLPNDEAVDLTCRKYDVEELSDKGYSGSDDFENEQVLVNTIDEAEEWVDVEVTVETLWDSDTNAIAQTGLVGDDSGKIKFVSWATSDLPRLEEGESYRLENVVTDEYEGRYSIKLQSATEITHLDEDIEIGENELSVSGAVVDIQHGSGLIKRCPDEDCTRVLKDGRCATHGDVDGEFDLRIKAVVDDGAQARSVLFQKEATEEILDLSLEEAKQMAMDALDTSVVADIVEDVMINAYVEATGPKLGEYVLADDYGFITTADADFDELLVEARELQAQA